MIRPLRARHRALFVLIALLLPPALALALASRRPPAAAHLPSKTDREPEAPAARWSEWEEIEDLDLRARRGRSDDGRRSLELSGAGPRRADVLLYLSDVQPTDGDLPSGARFLGPLGETRPAPRRIDLDPGARGWLVLYSLGDSSALGAIAIED